MADRPIARSAIKQSAPLGFVAGWEVSQKQSEAQLRLADLSPLAKIGIRAEGPVYGIAYGRSARVGDWLVVGSGPGEWTLLGPPGETTTIDSSGFVTEVDLTHGRALVRLTGDAAPRVMEKVCSIDLSDRMCPDRAAFRASVASVVTDVIRDDLGGTRSYLLSCERSSGQFLFDALMDAGSEFGIDIVGFSAR